MKDAIYKSLELEIYIKEWRNLDCLARVGQGGLAGYPQ